MEMKHSKNVDVAVKFLQNSNVRNTPYSKKLEFLRNKGLSQDEIEEALRRSGTNVEDHASNELKKTRTSSKKEWYFGDIVRYSILGTSVLAAANYAYKAYILPYMVHELKDDRRIEELLKAVQQMKDNADQNSYELNGTLKALQTLLQQQSVLLKSIDKGMPTTSASVSESTLQELKTELASIKSIVLGRKQFAPAPAFPAPSIPAWQRVTKESSDTKEDSSKTAVEEVSTLPSDIKEETLSTIPVEQEDAVELEVGIKESEVSEVIEKNESSEELAATSEDDVTLEEISESPLEKDTLKENQVIVVADICPKPASNTKDVDVANVEDVADTVNKEEKQSTELQDS